ncbi:MAG: sigma 54-interacting transcriptional regulator [Deltaproteobacteria bacterium]|nr:sigma 54-interacting transcriptional regulator [Deltaproteobacteria bacterium]
MLEWSELAGLRVIRRMGEIINRRWKLGVGFADSEGALVEDPHTEQYATRRPVCDLIKSTPEGRERCEQTAARMVEHYLEGGRREGSACIRCHAGLVEPYVPVEDEGEFKGLILAGGFLRESDLDSQLAEVERRIADLPLSRSSVQRACQKTPVLSEEAEGYLRDLLELVVNEIVVYRAEMARKERRLDRLTRELAERSSYGQIIGKSPPMKALYRTLDRVAATDSTALVMGENGTGKELVARAVHYHSSRKQQPFVVQNCSAFNDNLLDSELFGHARGAFTGAVGTKKGLFEVADRGTFFLDEIGDMSPALQVKLLRVLQEGTFIPVGSTEVRKVDVRIIAATNRDLKVLVEQGLFREDLYYRVNVVTLALPPLRERVEDIPLLVEHFLARHATPDRRYRLSSACLERMMDYNWPGNVRELENEIERLVVLRAEDEEIGEEFLSPRIRYEIYPQAAGAIRDQAPSLPEAVERLERTMILDHLKRSRWNKTRAAESLGISRRNLIRKVQTYKLDRRKNR